MEKERMRERGRTRKEERWMMSLTGILSER